jgi:hypothetical protein
MIKWLKYSGVWITVVVNPLHWQMQAETIRPDELNPKLYGVVVNLGPIVIRIIIDNGSW